jgi:hypothetical protein
MALIVKKWLNEKEVVEYLGFGNEKSLREWRNSGNLPFYKIGGRFVYNIEDIDAYMNNFKIPAFKPKFRTKKIQSR